MKQTKRILLTSLLVIIMILITAALTSCNDELSLSYYVGENKYETSIIMGNEKLTFPQNPVKSGYTFEGWYLDPETWEKPFYEDTLTESPAEENVNVYAKFTPIIYNVTYQFDSSLGDYPVNAEENPSTYTTDMTTKLTSLEYKDDTYDFKGWYTAEEGGKKITSFKGVVGDIVLYAQWELHKYPITYHDTNGATTIAADGFKNNPKEYTIESMDKADIPLLNIERVGYIFDGWYLDPEHTEPAPSHIVKGTTGELNFYAKWSTDESTYIRVNAEGRIDPEGTYFLFGRYPQSAVNDTDIIEILTKKAEENENLWTSYGYYSGNGTHSSQSNSEDFMWYIDIEHNGDEYRGVYFNEYRPTYTSGTHSDSYQKNNGYTTGKIYWFKYDFIKWKMISKTDDNKVLLLCDMVIDAQSYQSSYKFVNGQSYAVDKDGNIIRDAAGNRVYANNYAYSTIRAWLNNEFLNTAFSDLQKSLIQLTEVDNSAKTTDSEDNQYVCNNTNDFVFLQSFEDMTNTELGYNENPMASDSAKKKNPTAYAICQGASTQRDYKAGESVYWWLRSPDGEFDFAASIVGKDGYLSYDESVYATYHGVCPSLWITLE